MAKKIPGGYIILARRLLECDEIMNGPPLYAKLWNWMLLEANFKDHGNIKRGEFFTNIEEMRDAMAYKKGYCKIRPTRQQIRRSYECFTKAHMIATTKTTRGLIITILNYNEYQNPKNYEEHTEEHTEGAPKAQEGTHYKERRDTITERKLNSAGAAPAHFEKKLGIQIAEQIKKAATEYQEICNGNPKKINIYQWVQFWTNKNAHPLAIVDSIDGIIQRLVSREDIKRHWGYLDKIIKTKSGNYWEKENRRQATALKSPVVNAEIMNLINGIG